MPLISVLWETQQSRPAIQLVKLRLSPSSTSTVTAIETCINSTVYMGMGMTWVEMGRWLGGNVYGWYR
jgi:hypothetical protein